MNPFKLQINIAGSWTVSWQRIISLQADSLYLNRSRTFLIFKFELITCIVSGMTPMWCSSASSQQTCVCRASYVARNTGSRMKLAQSRKPEAMLNYSSSLYIFPTKERLLHRQKHLKIRLLIKTPRSLTQKIHPSIRTTTIIMPTLTQVPNSEPPFIRRSSRLQKLSQSQIS